MATGIETRIQEALNAHLRDMVLNPPLPIAWPNLKFTPPKRTARADGKPRGWYLRANPIVLPTAAIALAGGSNLYTGLFQIDVVFPADIGMTVPTEVVGSIVRHFRRGTRLWREGVRVDVVQAPYPAPALAEAPGMMIPVTVPYQSIHRNPA